MAISGCSRSADPLLTTTAAVSSTDQTRTDTEAVISDTTINTFTQPENQRFSKVAKRLYSNGVRNTATCTEWLTTVCLILMTFLME